MVEDEANARSGIGKQTARGLKWTLLGTVGANGARLIVFPLLGRLLSPADFGTVAAALTVIAFTQIVRDAGVGLALVQRKKLDPEHIEAAFAFSVVLGVFLAGLLFLSAPLVARFYGNPQVADVVKALAALFVLRGVSSVSLSMCSRQMRFRELALVELVGYVVGSGSSVGLAFYGMGPWSLVVGYLLETGLVAVGALVLAPQQMRLRFHKQHLRELLGFGTGSTAGNVAGYFAYQGDYMVVGRELGATQLGFYTRAYDLMKFPALVLTNIAGAVLFSAFSRIQDDADRLSRAFRRGLFVTAILLMPASAGLIVLAPEFITLLLGPQWSSAVVPFQVMAVSMFARASFKLGSTVARATGDVAGPLIANVVYGVLVIGGAFIGSRWGITGVAATTATAVAINFVVFSHLGIRRTSMTWSQFVHLHLEATGATLLAAIGLISATWLLRGASAPPALTLLLGSLAGLVGVLVAARYGVLRGQPDWTWLWTTVAKRASTLRPSRRRERPRAPPPSA